MNHKAVCRTAPATPDLLMSDKGVFKTAPATGSVNYLRHIGAKERVDQEWIITMFQIFFSIFFAIFSIYINPKKL